MKVADVPTTYTISRAADQRELINDDGKGGEAGQMKLW